MIKFYVEEMPTVKKYRVATPSGISEYTGMVSTSYAVVHARLFGLSLADWYRMMRDLCKAEVRGKNGLYKTVSFSTKSIAENYCAELNKRFTAYYNAKRKKVTEAYFR